MEMVGTVTKGTTTGIQGTKKVMAKKDIAIKVMTIKVIATKKKVTVMEATKDLTETESNQKTTASFFTQSSHASAVGTWRPR
jgi:hypothetical protein